MRWGINLWGGENGKGEREEDGEGRDRVARSSSSLIDSLVLCTFVDNEVSDILLRFDLQVHV